MTSGVKEYIIGECSIKEYFPVDFHDKATVTCYQCRYFSRNTGLCQLTKEVSEYPQTNIGSRCPFTFHTQGEEE